MNTVPGTSPAPCAVDPIAELEPLGGLERWLHDPTVSEVLVNSGAVWVERAGRLTREGTMREATVLGTIERILTPLGRRLDRLHPTVDARLPDGARLCAAIPPVSVDGVCLAVRRFAVHPLPLDRFASAEVADVLRDLVERRCNVVVGGATSSGKTSLLNALAQHVPVHERIITLEDVAELRLAHPHVVRLETRPSTPEGIGGVSLADLLHTALRLRPDRLVVGEVRGAEAADLLHALNTGHDGSLATVHANSPSDALDRLAVLALQARPGWTAEATERMIASAVDAVVHVARRADGSRAVAEVAEVVRAGTTRALATDGRAVATAARRRA